MRWLELVFSLALVAGVSGCGGGSSGDGTDDGAPADCMPEGDEATITLEEVTAHPAGPMTDVDCFVGVRFETKLPNEHVAIFDDWDAVDELLREQKGCGDWEGSFADSDLAEADYSSSHLALFFIGGTYSVPELTLVTSPDGEQQVVMLDDGYRCSGVAPPVPQYAFELPSSNGTVSFKSCVPPRETCLAP